MATPRHGPPSRRYRGLLAIPAAVLVLHALAAGAARIDVVRSGDAPLYRAAESGLRANVPEGVTVRGYALDAPREPCAGGCRLTVAVGTDALREVLEGGPQRPVFALLAPRRTFASIRAQRAGSRVPLSALYLDQPLDRQVRVARAVFPELDEIAVLLADDADLASFGGGDDSRPLAVVRVREREAPVQALERIPAVTDALAAVPDERIYSAGTLHGMLLGSYRSDMPIIGYSRSLVRAGGLITAWLDPREHGRAAAELLRGFLREGPGEWPDSQYSPRFRVMVNHSVARSLGLELAFDPEGRLFNASEPLP